MSQQKSLHIRSILTVSLSTATLVLSSGLLLQTSARTFPDSLVSLQFPTGSNRGAPARTTGGASRSTPCTRQPGKIPLTALTPKNNISKTLAANPSIYIYVPALTNKTALFRAIDKETEEVVYSDTIALPNRSGILKLTLPETVVLQPDRTYEWAFFVLCNPEDPTADEGIQGWLERTEIAPEQQAKIEAAQQQLLTQAQLYAEFGLWNETLAILAQLRDSNPTEWTELLESVGLNSEIARSSFIE
jgi:Domain of Unknown Function (DUF928)